MARPRVDRERILDAAMVALARNGTARLTLVDVAAEAGISRHTVHRRFASMDELMAESAEHLRARVERGITSAASSKATPRQRLEAVASVIYDQTVQAPFDRFLELQPAFYLAFVREHFDSWVEQVARALESGLGGPGLDRRRDAAELLIRQTTSYQLVAPRPRALAVAALIEGASGLLGLEPDG